MESSPVAAATHEHGVVVVVGCQSDPTEQLRTAMGAVRGHGCPLVLDLSAVPSPSSSTAALLLHARRECRRDGVRLVVRGLSRQGRRWLRRTGLAVVFELDADGVVER